MSASEESCRLDKWLWHARFVKTRSLAQDVCARGGVRINGQLTAKAHHRIRPGDVLTFPLASRIRIVRVIGTAERRGSAEVAQTLYEDLTPDADPVPAVADANTAKRPTKRQRRQWERWRHAVGLG